MFRRSSIHIAAFLWCLLVIGVNSNVLCQNITTTNTTITNTTITNTTITNTTTTNTTKQCHKPQPTDAATIIGRILVGLLGNETQSRIMNDFDLCNLYWIYGLGAEEMIAQAANPWAVHNVSGEWAPGTYHTAWISGDQNQTDQEVTLLTALFPGNEFTQRTGPFFESANGTNITYCGRTTNTSNLTIDINTLAFYGGSGFFELSTVDITDDFPINAYTAVAASNLGNIAAFYESVATTANCTELIQAYNQTGTPVVTVLYDGEDVYSLFIRTKTKRFEVVCGWPQLPDPCAGRNYGSCAKLSSNNTTNTTTQPPTTQAPTTQAPTTQPPIATAGASTQSPTTQAPSEIPISISSTGYSSTGSAP